MAVAATLLVGALVSGPALAQEGLEHQGCDPHAAFTAGGLTVSGAFTRAMVPGAPTAGGYFTIANSGTAADRLIGVKSDAAQAVQLHQMFMEGQMMVMGEVNDGLAIPAGGSVTLVPSNGYHLMFMGIGTPFKEGECVEVTLQFETAGALPVVLPVAGPAASEPPATQMDPNMKVDAPR